jgi:hypothetical protein
MTPIQPMQPFPAQPVSAAPRRELPGFLKAVLGLKVLGCLLTMGLSFLMLLEFSNPSDRPVGMSPAFAQHLAQLAMIATGVSMIELFGVAGTWTFKRWGVYVLAGFSMLSFVVRMNAGDAVGAVLSLASTMIVGFGIILRWKDFE